MRKVSKVFFLGLPDYAKSFVGSLCSVARYPLGPAYRLLARKARLENRYLVSHLREKLRRDYCAALVHLDHFISSVIMPFIHILSIFEDMPIIFRLQSHNQVSL